MPTRTTRRRCAAIAGVLLLAVAPYAVGAQGDLEQQLTGGSSRAWVLHRIVRPPVASDACVSGATYTFAASHDLQVTRCQDGRLATSHHAWAVQGGQGDAPTLVVTGMGTYTVMLRDARPGPRLLHLHARSTLPGWPGGDEELYTDED